jgi:hypothetical protein
VNKEEAKRILLAYRPGSPDRADPEVAEALEVAGEDPDLQKWVQDQAAFHRRVSQELRRLPIPRDLREKILTQGRVVVPVWRRPEWLLLAACVVISLFLAAFWFRAPAEDETFASFQARMVSFAVREYRMDIETNNLAAVQQLLASSHAPTQFALTPSLQKTPVKGGAALSWQGHPVAMVCFSLSKKETAYLFVMARSALPQRDGPGSQPLLQEIRTLQTASWSRDGQVYLIAARRQADLKALVAQWRGGREWLAQSKGSVSGDFVSHFVLPFVENGWM